MLSMNEAGVALEPFEDQLKEVFHAYATYGNPLNSTNLKSSLLLKMMRDCGLVAEQSVLAKQFKGKVRQVFTVEVDLLFKQVCNQVSNTQTAYS